MTDATAGQQARQVLETRAQAFAASEECSLSAAYDWVTSRTEEGRSLLSIALDDRAERPVRAYLNALRRADEWERWAATMRLVVQERDGSAGS